MLTLFAIELIPALAFAALVVPPSVFAAFPPRTPRWRTARKVYWIAFPIATAWFAANLALLDPAGPAVLYYGSWLGFVIAASAWAWAGGTIRGEWSLWREGRRAGAAAPARVPDPAQPWQK